MSKKDCKYWEKCYQKNEQHLEKYNHPKKVEQQSVEEKLEESGKNVAPKRKASLDKDKEKAQTSSTGAESAANTNSVRADKSENEEFDTTELRKEALHNMSGKNYMEILEKRIKLSVKREYEDLLRTNEFIRHNFLVEMPPDFYEFWKFVSELKKDTEGMAVIKYLDTQFKLQLVGPFEFLAGRFHKAKICEPGDYLRHWRFYYDPPEFQTLFVRRGTGIHYGYWRDTPQDKEHLLLARNDASAGCEFDFIAGNVFDAFLYYLEKDFVGSPFSAATVASTKKSMQKYITENSLELDNLDVLRKARSKNVVAKTFHKAGIVVPFDSETQVGYRPLMISDAELKKILKLFEHVNDKNDDSENDSNVKKVVLEKLTPVANAANIAVDECDFGTAFELGMDLFCSGRKELHMLVTSLLVPAYTLLSRPQFIAITKAHMEQRNHDFNLSVFDWIERKD